MDDFRTLKTNYTFDDWPAFPPFEFQIINYKDQRLLLGIRDRRLRYLFNLVMDKDDWQRPIKIFIDVEAMRAKKIPDAKINQLFGELRLAFELFHYSILKAKRTSKGIELYSLGYKTKGVAMNPHEFAKIV